MKKFILTGFIFLAWANVQAQDIHFGLKAGLNATNLLHSNQTEAKAKLNIHAGGLAHIHLFDKFALQPEIIYSGQGYKRVIASTERVTNLSYLNIPVLVQYMFANGFRLQAGPQVGFLLSANEKVKGKETDLGGKYRTIDFSIPVGVSYVSPLGIGVDARWAYSLNNINDVGSRYPNIRNSVGQLGVFYLLHYKPAKRRFGRRY